MRLHHILLLTGAALFASLDASSATMGLKMINPRFTTTFRSLPSTRRLLRVGNDEERASLTIPGVGKLADLLERKASRVVQNTRFRAWILSRTSTDDVFMKLKLNTVGTKIFDDPKFITWVVYVTKVHKQNPEEIILSKLMTQFSADTLAKMIAAASRVSKTEGLAIALETHQWQVWLSAGKSTDDVFSLLKLDKMGKKLFKSSLFSTWTSYVEAFNRKNPEEAVSIFTKLTKLYDDVTLSKMLEAAKKVSRTKTIATKLQSQQIQTWIDAGATTDDIFRLFKLDKTGTHLFQNPQITTWTSYVEAFNRKNPEEAVSIFTKLTKLYDDVTLSKMLEAAKKVSRTKTIATKLQSQQIQTWIDAGATTDDIFRLFKLDKTGTHLFQNPQITTWTSYVDAFNKNFPDDAVSIFAKLSKTYDDVTLSSMLEVAKSVPATKKIASYLQAQQNQHWLADGKSTDDIFVLLKLNTASLDNLSDPRLSAWTSFMRAFNMASTPGQEASLVATMTKHYTERGLAQLLEAAKKVPRTEKIAKDLQVAQFTRWLNQDKTQDDVSKLLQLKQNWHNDPDSLILRQYNQFYKAHSQVIGRSNRHRA